MNAELQKISDQILAERTYYANMPLDEFMKYVKMANTWTYDELDEIDSLYILEYRGLTMNDFEAFKKSKNGTIKRERRKVDFEEADKSEWTHDINCLSEREFLEKWESRITRVVMAF